MTFRRRFFEKLNLARDHRRYKINKRSTKNFTVCTQKPEYRPSVPNLKNILMAKRQLIKNQPMLREIFNDPPILSYRRGRSLKNILVKELTLKVNDNTIKTTGILISNGCSRNLSKLFL